MALGTPRSDRAEARGQLWAAEDAGSVARRQLQTAARSSHTRVSGPLTVDGVGHAAELLTSSCATAATTHYLLTGATPPPGTVCDQDFTPFDQPAA